MSNLRNLFRAAIETASGRIHNSQDWDAEYYGEPTVMDSLLDRLEAITSERVQDHKDTALACLRAAGGSEDLDELERQCNEAGPKPSFFVRKQFEKLREQRDAAWRVAQSLQDILDGRFRPVDEVIKSTGCTEYTFEVECSDE